MSGNANNSPMMKTTGLWAKFSVKGGRYLTGRLGGVKVLILANKDRQSDNDPSHILYFGDGEKLRQSAQDRGGEAKASQAPRTSQRPSQPQRSGFQAHAIAEDDDVPPWER
jgi:hypothetical protein